MSNWDLPWNAACMCGQVEMHISAAPLVSMACHCTGCQKLTSGPYSLSLLVPETGFEITRGDPTIGGLHGEHKHFFCAHCKNWLFTRPKGMPFVNVRPGMLEDPSWVRPFAETMTRDRLEYAESGAEFSFEEFPSPEDFELIIAAFTDKGARPQSLEHKKV